MHLRTIAMLYKLILTLFYSQQRLELGARVGDIKARWAAARGEGRRSFRDGVNISRLLTWNRVRWSFDGNFICLISCDKCLALANQCLGRQLFKSYGLCSKHWCQLYWIMQISGPFWMLGLHDLRSPKVGSEMHKLNDWPVGVILI